MHSTWCTRAVAALILSGAARAAAAQSVMLRIKPQVGDTIRMRLDQQSEMTGVRRTESGEASAMVLTTMTMFSRAIVEGISGDGIAVLAVTDSVKLSTTDDRTRIATQQMQSQMQGQQTRFRVLPDGSVSMMQADGGGAPREVAQVVSLMPATFPKTPIPVGQTWSREMSLPVGTQLGAQVSAKLQVKFRLDSLTHNGKVACVSMRGDMRPASGPGAASGAVLEKGLVSGTMLVDQQRGWLKESWFNIVVSSSLKPAPSTNTQPIRMQMRITQHMRTVERR